MPPPKRYRFIATLGLSPQVITEALDALHDDEQIVPERIELVATRYSRSGNDSEVLDRERQLRRQIGELYEDRRTKRGSPIAPESPRSFADGKAIEFHYIQSGLLDERGNPTFLKDIETPEHHDAFMKVMAERIHCRGGPVTGTEQPTGITEPALIVLLAGGRKTMSSGTQELMVLLGRPDDRLCHVLVSPSAVEDTMITEPFWFRKTGGRTRMGAGKATVPHEDVKINLINIEFHLARGFLEHDDQSLPLDISLKAAKAVRHAPDTGMKYNANTQTLIYRGVKRKLKQQQFVLLSALQDVYPQRVDIFSGEYTGSFAGLTNRAPFHHILSDHLRYVDPEKHAAEMKIISALVDYFRSPSQISFDAFSDMALPDESGSSGNSDKSQRMFEYTFLSISYFNLAIAREQVLGDLNTPWFLPEGHDIYFESYVSAWMANVSHSEKLKTRVFQKVEEKQQTQNAQKVNNDTSKKTRLNLKNCFAQFNIRLSKPPKRSPGEPANAMDSVERRAKWTEDGSLINKALLEPDENYLIMSEIAVKSFSKTSRDRRERFDLDTDSGGSIGMYAVPPQDIEVIPTKRDT